MSRGKRSDSDAEKEQAEESALGQSEESEDESAQGRHWPERMPQWRTGNPNNSGFAGGVMRRVEERLQERKGKRQK